MSKRIPERWTYRHETAANILVIVGCLVGITAGLIAIGAGIAENYKLAYVGASWAWACTAWVPRLVSVVRQNEVWRKAQVLRMLKHLGSVR